PSVTRRAGRAKSALRTALQSKQRSTARAASIHAVLVALRSVVMCGSTYASPDYGNRPALTGGTPPKSGARDQNAGDLRRACDRCDRRAAPVEWVEVVACGRPANG